jgi:tight adherence protein C
MLEYFEKLSDIIGHYVSFKVGDFHFGLIEECIRRSRFINVCMGAGIGWGPVEIFIFAIAVATAVLSAVNLWRIGQREGREDRLAALRTVRFGGPETAAPPLLPWYHRLGAMLAASPIVGIAEQHRLLEVLATAGIKGHGDLATFVASKACGAVSVGAFVWLFLVWQELFATLAVIRLAALIGGLLLGWRLPDVVLLRLAARRRGQIEQGLPDALDLLVISAEAGLSLDQAIDQVAHDMRAANPAVADEFAATAAEMQVLTDRSEALENMVRRTGIVSLRGIAATLNQAIRFGTPLAESMRILAAELRTDRLARLEERAARLPVLLAVPMMLFILPCLLMVIGTPVVLRVGDTLRHVLHKGF